MPAGAAPRETIARRAAHDGAERAKDDLHAADDAGDAARLEPAFAHEPKLREREPDEDHMGENESRDRQLQCGTAAHGAHDFAQLRGERGAARSTGVVYAIILQECEA
nr:hypothetical protein [Paraburkholderia sp. J63]